MKESIFTLKRKIVIKKTTLILILILYALPNHAQPTNINIINCGTAAYNGNYQIVSGTYSCLGCDGYEKIGSPGTIIHRETILNDRWNGSTSGFNCFSLSYSVQSGETDCDPTNGGISIDGCMISSGLLPVELVDFDAEVRNDLIHLSWSTASEINNEGFEIERSTDGRNFDFIAFAEGHGNTTIMKDYSYKDDNVKEGQTYYYRLRQVDFDGAFEYSQVVAANLQITETVAGNFYPNPTKGAINFKSNYLGVQFQIYDSNGINQP